MANKRNLIDELMEGVAAMKAYRAGKTTLHEIDDVIAEAKRRVG